MVVVVVVDGVLVPATWPVVSVVEVEVVVVMAVVEAVVVVEVVVSVPLNVPVVGWAKT